MIMKKYDICWLQICPFDRLEGGILKPNRDDYPYRLCVLDRESSIAIDVKDEVSYEYIRTSTVYFLNQEAKKVEKDKRYAIMEINLYMKGIEKEDYIRANKIINKLNAGKEFIDGNSISNEEYLKNINNENNKVILKKRKWNKKK